MSTGLAVFDTTIQQSNEWLKQVETKLRPCDRQDAYSAFRAVLHALRDRLPTEAVLGLSAQLPLLLRGVFLEGWRIADRPNNIRSAEEFGQAVAQHLAPGFPRHGQDAAEAVFGVLSARLDPGETAKLVRHLPLPLRGLFPPEHRAT